MSTREFGTCFFEQYAQITLSALLGSEFDCLVNRDRPDLQSLDNHSIGIEVTRAMEQSKRAEEELLHEISGRETAPTEEEMEQILESGYAYGLERDRYIGTKEFLYWSMALPMRRILESKVSKVGNGFYGHFDKMGLFVFSRDNLGERDAVKAMDYVLSLQKNLDRRFNRLYLLDIDDFFVCRLEDGLREKARLERHRITQEQRKAFYTEAVHRQMNSI